MTVLQSFTRQAALQAVYKLHPGKLAQNPVMLVVALGSLWATFECLRHPGPFVVQIALWLWFTVLFANLAEAVAEGRGKAQAEALRKTRSSVPAARYNASGTLEIVDSDRLRKGDRIRVEAGQVIPVDGEVLEGVASVDESAITGESAPVLREAGGDRSAVTGGTTVLSDWLVIRVQVDPGQGFLDRMISMVEGAKRQKTPNELALQILLAGLTILFVLVCISLRPMSTYPDNAPVPTLTLVALLICLIPTTIGGLLSAIGIAGMDRLLQKNVMAMSGRAVEAAGDVDVLLLDKTGTITFGNRQAVELYPEGIDPHELARLAALASLADLTPEGKSIVVLARQRFGVEASLPEGAEVLEFTAQTRMSGLSAPGLEIRKGASDAVRAYVESQGHWLPGPLLERVDEIARQGGTPLLIASQGKAVGAVYLKDVIKPGMRERFQQLRQMGIKTVMVTGDNPITAAAIAAEAGVDDFLAQATPENKLSLIRQYQEGGRLVAMTGDGTNDAPALAQADVAVAMNSGTQAAREAANLIDLDSDPTKLIEIVEVGKQLLITRGALTTFSLANDVAKYFAILPAAFATSHPQLQALNVMGLGSPESAILAATVFNALIIVVLIPLALKGVAYRPLGAAQLLRNHLLIYGLGGLITPFLGIWLLDSLMGWLV